MAALAEYLKKYNSDAGPSVKQKKKKKEKRKGLRDTSGGLRIVDADVVWQKDTQHDSEDDEGENSGKNYVEFRIHPSDMWPEYLKKSAAQFQENIPSGLILVPHTFSAFSKKSLPDQNQTLNS